MTTTMTIIACLTGCLPIAIDRHWSNGGCYSKDLSEACSRVCGSNWRKNELLGFEDQRDQTAMRSKHQRKVQGVGKEAVSRTVRARQ